MISFAKIMRRVLSETMSFSKLLATTEPGRVERGKNDVTPRSIRVQSMDGDEAWTFSYKSNPSTTGKRWHGYVRFLKENVENTDNAKDLDCMVDCDCPDYRYRWAYNNAKAGAGLTGDASWNKNNGNPPRPREKGGVGDLGEGLCKHLVSLGKFLETKIEPTAPEPVPVKPAPIPIPSKPSTPSNVGMAPEPPKKKPSYYSDTRSGDLMEKKKGSLFERIRQFVKSNPTFDVTYEG